MHPVSTVKLHHSLGAAVFLVSAFDPLRSQGLCPRYLCFFINIGELITADEVQCLLLKASCTQVALFDPCVHHYSPDILRHSDYIPPHIFHMKRCHARQSYALLRRRIKSMSLNCTWISN